MQIYKQLKLNQLSKINYNLSAPPPPLLKGKGWENTTWEGGLNELPVKNIFSIRLIVYEMWRTRLVTGSKLWIKRGTLGANFSKYALDETTTMQRINTPSIFNFMPSSSTSWWNNSQRCKPCWEILKFRSDYIYDYAGQFVRCKPGNFFKCLQKINGAYN